MRHKIHLLAVMAGLVLVLTACDKQKEASAATAAPAQTTTPAPSNPKPAEPTQAEPATPAPAAQASPCDTAADPKRCFASEPLLVNIINIDHTLGPYHTIRMNIEVRNIGKAPVTLGYQFGTGKATDSLGNGYAVKAAPTGIPTDYGSKTDARLTLQPGEAHMGTFEAGGYRTDKDPTSFNYDMTIDELSTEKPNPVLREHAVYFRGLTPAMPGK